MDRETSRNGFGQESPSVYGSNAEWRTPVRVPRRKNSIRVGAIAIGKMLGALMEGCSVNELSEESGLARQTIRRYLREFHKNKVIHISEWTEDDRGVRTVKVWSFGDKPDAKKPQPITAKEACAKYRAKMKQIKLMQQMTGQYK